MRRYQLMAFLPTIGLLTCIAANHPRELAPEDSHKVIGGAPGDCELVQATWWCGLAEGSDFCPEAATFQEPRVANPNEIPNLIVVWPLEIWTACTTWNPALCHRPQNAVYTSSCNIPGQG